MNYAYNGKGEQTRRYPTTTSTAQTYASYDEAGHTVGVYDHAGNRIQEVIWLDDLPIGVIDTSKLHYVQADHLGTPRNVIDPVAEKSVWAWQLGNEAFGDSTPNQDPDNNGTAFAFDLRFPGQRYDSASGLNYNYFRDYEPNTGRYRTSDPIGLKDGLATYSYVDSSPLLATDPYGLAKWTGFMAIGFVTIPTPGASRHLNMGLHAASLSLISGCVRGQKWMVQIAVVGAGAAPSKGITKRGSFSGTTVSLDDGNPNGISPYAFNGPFTYYGAGIKVYSFMATLAVGDAYGSAEGWGATTDYFGAWLLTGEAVVTNAKPLPCDVCEAP
ncbi:RHS repeat-associated core domain-containing protein [Lysobacter sp. Root604]|uniref:RHS repeat-associated core domain-containing protein n=1 Tax=Lysobacter sp. Root604 TaxID=1736568 RepID=UPI001F28E6F2|nr:RHS repeat-associated core domain-containing protein [Lysobacter sp. Root604]